MRWLRAADMPAPGSVPVLAEQDNRRHRGGHSATIIVQLARQRPRRAPRGRRSTGLSLAITITMSLGRAPGMLRRSARPNRAWSAATNRVIAASEMIVSATGSSTLSATAATPAARPSRPSRRPGCQAPRRQGPLAGTRGCQGAWRRGGAGRGHDPRQQVGHVARGLGGGDWYVTCAGGPASGAGGREPIGTGGWGHGAGLTG